MEAISISSIILRAPGRCVKEGGDGRSLCRNLTDAERTLGTVGDPGKIRTSDTQFRKLLLYPPELRGHI